MEKLKKIVNALPTINSDIVDPARHEKILSYLKGEVNDKENLENLFNSIDVLDIIRASLMNPDFRINSLSLRFLGHLISIDIKYNDGFSKVFNNLKMEYREILYFILDKFQVEDEENLDPIDLTPPQLKFGCLEFLIAILDCSDAAEWLLDSNHILEIVLQSLTDSCIYNNTSGANLAISIISKRSRDDKTYHALYENLMMNDYFLRIIKESLDPNSSIDDQMMALEVMWILCNSKNNFTILQFLCETQLLQYTLILLLSHGIDQNVKFYAADCLKTVLNWADNPATLFSNVPYLEDECKADNFQITKILILSFVSPALQNSFSNSEIVDILISSSYVLQMLISIYHRHKCANTLSVAFLLLDCFNSLCGINNSYSSPSEFDIIKEELLYKISIIIDSNYSILVAEKYLNAISLVLPFEDKSNIEKSKMLNEMIIESCLKTLKKDFLTEKFLLTLLKTVKSLLFSIHQLYLEEKIIPSLLAILTNNNNPNVVKSILEIFQIIIDPLKAKFDKKNFFNVLSKLLEISAWDIRDHIVIFIGSLFYKNFSDTVSSKFAVDVELPKLIFKSLKDEQSFVRASALKGISSMVLCPSGWNYLLENASEVSTNDMIDTPKTLLAHKITSLLDIIMNDSEAFVRRSALLSLISLIENQDFLISEKKSNQIFLPEDSDLWRKTILHAKNDNDWEVRKKLATLIEILFFDMIKKIEIYSLENFNFQKILFFFVNADLFILDLVKDDSRSVKEEVYKVLKKMKSYLTKNHKFTNDKDSGIKKRDRLDDTIFSQFCLKVLKLDLEELRERSLAEGLYDEALRVDVEFLVREDDLINDGNNVLTCYDC